MMVLVILACSDDDLCNFVGRVIDAAANLTTTGLECPGLVVTRITQAVS